MKPMIPVFSNIEPSLHVFVQLSYMLKLNYDLQNTCCLLSVCLSVQVSFYVFSHINFLRITESSSKILVIEHSEVKTIQVCSMKDRALYQREIKAIHIENILTTYSLEPPGQFQPS